MKGLDTSALLEILEGTPVAKKELKRLRGQELATTEGNLLELAAIAARGPARARPARLAALTRLRRRLTVLPLDARAVDAACQQVAKGVGDGSPLLFAILGAFEVAGCEEFLTADATAIPGRWRFSSRKFGK